MSSKVNYESLASVMPRNEQETDAVVDPVIAEMNARLEAEFAAENEHTTRATRTVFVSVAVRHSLVRTVLL